MNKFGMLALTIGMLTVGTVNAAEIVREVTSETSGQATGGMSGMMAGSVGGPIGAVIGAGFGALFGGSGQKALGASERIYLVRTDSGELKKYRSPNYVFAEGDKVVPRQPSASVWLDSRDRRSLRLQRQLMYEVDSARVVHHHRSRNGLILPPCSPGGTSDLIGLPFPRRHLTSDDQSAMRDERAVAQGSPHTGTGDRALT
ncbi:hypothetical protein AvCA_35450 [Azotobacter vinelandii CA]|uniref:Glycine zipper domain-containing protein n=2 Tax=Azotobacter vinelandii TaxID=354 RepID=C1DR36_AZOVD|nr:hypothetical protein [Azotobacter vinelandii]ACO79694.1 hypothetical protein Avin_35450 [Azotobacter vinelandii DJ]AGK14602.1 hypothetical protein AvCA_35450 [Azotobacter vinelandii CA]AGK21422.1 hypothetical protein AvCA6_35450 [Azotobacter vinelandii CA6]SFX23653.1 hypothetical protein SAMN04244547_00812 [Azotobacter vinelandii]GLK57922.1 hypothetical protein GCM10017624_00790 [Azotobacter vinelandii]